VALRKRKKGGKGVLLSRSKAMEADLSGKAIAVRTDAASENPECQGLLYMMFWKDRDGGVVPLYIGKAEAGGRKHAISRLFTNKKKCPLPRWDDSKEYHIGGLSTWACEGYAEAARAKGKDKWAKKLFRDLATQKPQLKQPVYLWVRIWKNSDLGMWADYGTASMCMQEGMLIDIASRLYPNDLLNTEGVLR